MRRPTYIIDGILDIYERRHNYYTNGKSELLERIIKSFSGKDIRIAKETTPYSFFTHGLKHHIDSISFSNSTFCPYRLRAAWLAGECGFPVGGPISSDSTYLTGPI